MTVIAYKDNLIAMDSRMSAGSYILDDNYLKYAHKKDYHFFYTGSEFNLDVLIEHTIDKKIGKNPGYDISCAALVLDSKGLFWQAAFDYDDGFWVANRDLNKYYAIGRGMTHAITTMDLGFTAEEAVKMAIKREASCGGEIRIFNLKT